MRRMKLNPPKIPGFRTYVAVVMSTIDNVELPAVELDEFISGAKLYIDYEIDAVCLFDIFDKNGNYLSDKEKVEAVILSVGAYAEQVGVRVAYYVEASDLEAPHISRINSMIRSGQIDALVVDGNIDEVTTKVLGVFSRLGVEIIVIKPSAGADSPAIESGYPETFEQESA